MAAAKGIFPVLSSLKSTPPEPGPAPEPSPAPAPAPTPERRQLGTPAWHRWLSAVAAWVSGQLRRPRTRLAVIGVVLLLVAIVGLVSSVWTLPLVIVGIVMVLVAWIGARLDGRFAVQWGETGTQLEFRAQIKAPAPTPAALAPAPAVPGPAVRVPTLTQIDDSDVIEGEGHTVEIDVAELKALIASAEARESRGSTAAGSSAQPAPGADESHRDRPAA